MSLLAAALALLVDPDTGCPAPAEAAARQEAFASYALGQAAVNDGRLDKALAPLQDAIRGNQLLPQAHYALGQAFMGLRRFADAVDAFTASRDVFLCLARLGSAQRGELERRLDQEIHEVQTAIRAVERDDLVGGSVAGKEANRSAFRSRAETMRLVRQLEDRLGQLRDWKRRGLGLRPPAEVHVALGTAHFQAGSPADAERELREALRLDSGNGDAHHNLAVVYLATGRIAEAEHEAKRAARAGVEVNPRLLEEIRRRKTAR